MVKEEEPNFMDKELIKGTGISNAWLMGASPFSSCSSSCVCFMLLAAFAVMMMKKKAVEM